MPTTNAAVAASSASAAEEEEEEEQLLALDDYLPPSHPLRSLLDATSDACVPLEVDGINANGDGSFRYEWGTWCSRVKLDALSDRALGELRLRAGAYDDLLRPADDGGAATDNKGGGRRIRIASGKYWDVVLHLLPRGARVQHKWPEGSWTVLQPLTGVIEVSQLRGPDGDGYYVPTRPKDLRGGGDGSGAIGSGGGGGDGDGGAAGGGGGGYSTAAGGGSGARYLGGPLRRYAGKAMSGSTLLEVNVRPPIEANVDAAIRYGGGVVDDERREGGGGAAVETMEEMDWEMANSVFARVERKREIEPSRGEEDDAEEGSSSPTVTPPPLPPPPSSGLNKKLGMEFENVGGLDAQLDDIAVSGFLEILRRSSSSSLPAGARFVSRSFFRPRALPTTDAICCVLIGKRTHSSFVLIPPPAPLTPTLRFGQTSVACWRRAPTPPPRVDSAFRTCEEYCCRDRRGAERCAVLYFTSPLISSPPPPSSLLISISSSRNNDATLDFPAHPSPPSAILLDFTGEGIIEVVGREGTANSQRPGDTG